MIHNRKEVKEINIYEYDEELHERTLREEGREEGQTILFKIISQLSSGVSADELIASGVSSDTISLAEQSIEEIRKNYQA